MSTPYEPSEASLILRQEELEKQAKAMVITHISDLVDAFEKTDAKIDISNEYSIDVDKAPGIIVPQTITKHIGEVSFVTASLNLAVDTLHKDEDIAPDYTEEPSLGRFLDVANLEVPIDPEDAVTGEASNITLSFFGSYGIFVMSRSNLEDNGSHKDTVFLNESPHDDGKAVDAVTNNELGLLILSITHPNLADRYDESPVDITSPRNFNPLNDLLSPATRHTSSYRSRQLLDKDASLTYAQEYNSKEKRLARTFTIRFKPNGPKGNLVVVTRNLDTNSDLTFKYIDADFKFTPTTIELDESALEEGASTLQPYKPSLDELSYLNKLLEAELFVIETESTENELPLDILEDVAAVDGSATDTTAEVVVENLSHSPKTKSEEAIRAEIEEIIRQSREDENGEG